MDTRRTARDMVFKASTERYPMSVRYPTVHTGRHSAHRVTLNSNKSLGCKGVQVTLSGSGELSATTDALLIP
jgi:hypothetical protein